jgi:hypothetical protein
MGRRQAPRGFAGAGGTGRREICAAFVVAEVTVLSVVPPQGRWIMAGMLAAVTAVLLIAVSMEAGFRRSERERAADARAGKLPRRPREHVSPLIQRAYHLARDDQSASHIAGSCDIPEAFARLIIDDVRQAPWH